MIITTIKLYHSKITIKSKLTFGTDVFRKLTKGGHVVNLPDNSDPFLHCEHHFELLAESPEIKIMLKTKRIVCFKYWKTGEVG